MLNNSIIILFIKKMTPIFFIKLFKVYYINGFNKLLEEQFAMLDYLLYTIVPGFLFYLMFPLFIYLIVKMFENGIKSLENGQHQRVAHIYEESRLNNERMMNKYK